MKKMWIIILLIIVVVLTSYVTTKINSSRNIETTKEYVYALIDKGLYSQAANEYKKLIESGKYNDKERANIAYLLGNLHMENTHNYEEALANYTLVKVLAPNSNLKDEVSRKTVECLERLGRSADAQREMEQTTLLNKKAPIPKDIIVARIGKKGITYEELEKQIRNLPQYIQNNYNEPSKKLEFLKQYIATELLYDSAKRKNLESNPEIQEQTFQAKKSLMVQKLLEEELKGKINVSESEIKLYYEAHKKDFVEKDKDKKEKQKSLDEAKNEIMYMLQQEKGREEYMKLLDRLMKAEKVEIFDNSFNNGKK